MGANSEMGKLMFDPLGKKAEAELEQRNARISTLEQQLKESTARYDKLFIRRTGGQTTQYKVDKQGKRVGDIKTIPTRRPSGSGGTNLKIQGTGTNLG